MPAVCIGVLRSATWHLQQHAESLVMGPAGLGWCCGIASALGYGVAQHDVSKQTAQLSLLPAVRTRLDSLIVVDGTSFRH